MVVIDMISSSNLRNSDDWKRLLTLLKERSFEKRQVILSSGKSSDYYVDAKRVLLDPEGAYLNAKLMLKLVEPDVHIAAGMTLGADPIVSALALLSHIEGRSISGLIVRKEPKKHGTKSYIEGPKIKEGSTVVVVDDVVTTGGSILRSIERLELEGYKVVKALAVLDRMEGGQEAIKSKGYTLDTLFTKDDLL